MGEMLRAKRQEQENIKRVNTQEIREVDIYVFEH